MIFMLFGDFLSLENIKFKVGRNADLVVLFVHCFSKQQFQLVDVLDRSDLSAFCV